MHFILCRMTTVSKKWLVNISEFQPGRSAVLNDNYLTFYGIHTAAITLLLISLVSCIIVIIYILSCSRKDRWDFPDRFPLYLAIADLLYGVSNLFGHVVLITTKCFPEEVLANWLSINFFIFFGYEQLMHGGLAAYTYLKVVRQTSTDLGRAEWRLHVMSFTLLVILVAIFYPFGAFGSSGYWFSADGRTSAGFILGFIISGFATLHALCTTLSYWSIKKAVEAHRKTIASYMGPYYQIRARQCRNHITANDCLTTFILIAVCLYCPLAVGAWIVLIQAVNGVMEPTTALFIICVANSGGWANSLGYWHNKVIKDRNPKTKRALTQSTLIKR